RLAAVGLLETEFKRRSGRNGPGAGRPAKLYRRGQRDVTVSLPPRDYERAADVLADALARPEGQSAREAVVEVARARGQEAGNEARKSAGRRPSRRRLEGALLDLLGKSGYEPQVDAGTRAVRLRNCPYHALAERHRDLTCGMNLAWAQGIVDGLGDPMVRAELASQAGYCCVTFDLRSDED
ncbi:MAG: transcriptional regulator, partial [Candidatus Limnocylindria bacterium]